jgi:hypothetical protein
MPRHERILSRELRGGKSVCLAATVAPGAHAVLLVDQAGWHLSTGLAVPPNITIMALPQMSRAQSGRKRLAVPA